ncbi:MAG: hypothetical protein RR614_06060 [Eubacterium sp.]
MKVKTVPVNSIRLCLDHCSGGGLEGKIIGVALKDSIHFRGLRAFVTQVDKAFDTIGKPQSHQITRSFKQTEPVPTPFLANPPRYHELEEIVELLGAEKTLDLVMITRRHTEWQGILKDTEGNSVGRFNSVLECIQLITEEKDQVES